MLFSWELLAVSSLLVTLQFQLVEYSLHYFNKFNVNTKLFSKWDVNSNIFELALTSILMPWVFGFIFVSCEPGERVTKQFELFGTELDRCDWYALPIKLQHTYSIFILDTHQTKVIQSYGGIVCSRDTFKKVFGIQFNTVASHTLSISKKFHLQITNTGFSYFMTLRQFGS